MEYEATFDQGVLVVDEDDGIGSLEVCFRGITLANLLLLVLLCIPAIGGTGDQPGLIDRVFGQHEGFRPDFVWLAFSSGAIFLAIFFFALEAKTRQSARTTMLLCIAEVIAFFGFLFYSLLAGVLDFG